MFHITGVEQYSNGRRRRVANSPGGVRENRIKLFPGGDFFLGRGGGIELDPDEGGFRWRVNGEDLTFKNTGTQQSPRELPLIETHRGSAISIELVRFDKKGAVVERKPLELRTDARGSTSVNPEYAVFNGIHASLIGGGDITARLLPNSSERG
ncbi:hypothetical protein HY338_03215 [Candidatus Gottesmanbacteria bacterium]|nr:hypothetical protein [Candidatus Gottesmanbacteria bacterium]